MLLMSGVTSVDLIVALFIDYFELLSGSLFSLWSYTVGLRGGHYLQAVRPACMAYITIKLTSTLISMHNQSHTTDQLISWRATEGSMNHSCTTSLKVTCYTHVSYNMLVITCSNLLLSLISRPGFFSRLAEDSAGGGRWRTGLTAGVVITAGSNQRSPALRRRS